MIENYKINLEKLPKHIAIIMDGNGRWAKAQGHPRSYGHIEGVKNVKKIVSEIVSLNIPYITLFAFSKENWKRPKKEIKVLMSLFVKTIIKNKNHFLKEKIKIQTIGSITELPEKCQSALSDIQEVTKNNKGTTLTLAMSYSARAEIVECCKKLLLHGKGNEINESTFSKNLYTKDMPDPELLIRTSGEKRISNFLLWQIAYTELYFSEKKWPEFNKEELYMSIFEYQKRERRFGRTTEQIIDENN